MPSMPVPNIQVATPVPKGQTVNAPSTGGDPGGADDPAQVNFGDALQSRIEELATSLKLGGAAPQKPGLEIRDADKKAGLEGSADGSQAAQALLPAFVPVSPIAVAPSEVKVQVDDKTGRLSAVVASSHRDTAAAALTTQAGKVSPEQIGLPAEISGSGKNLPVKGAVFGPVAQLTEAGAGHDKGGGDIRMDGAAVAGLQGQTSSTQGPAQTPPVATAAVSLPVGNPGWDSALGQRLVWMASQQHQVAQLHLNPPHLGPIEIQLSIVHDQATAAFVSHHAGVRDAIESALPRLREMLAESGINLGNVSVGSQSFAQQQAFSGDSPGTPWRGGGASVSVPGTGLAAGLQGGLLHVAGNGMVDTFA